MSESVEQRILEQSLLCVHNVSASEQLLRIDLDALRFPHAGRVRDVVAGVTFPVDDSGEPNLRGAPYQVLWLTGGVV